MDNLLVVGAGGGLADRTRVLFSYLQFARKQQRKLTMLWEHNNHLDGNYEDVFEPLPDVTFVCGKQLQTRHKENLFYWGPAAHPEYKSSVLLVREMRPILSVVEAVKKTLDQLQFNFIALHVRRFDLELNTEPMSFDEFDRFIEERLQPGQKIFLATDATPTQTRFQEKYGNKVVVFRDIPRLGGYGKRKHIWQRQTGLFHTVVDLFVCTFSQDFLGTQLALQRYSKIRWSGFSNIIEKFRKHYRQFGLPIWL